MDVGEDTTLRDDDTAEETVELLIVANGELQVTGDDTRLLVVTGGSRTRECPSPSKGQRGQNLPSGVTGEFENFGGEVLEDGREVDWLRKAGRVRIEKAKDGMRRVEEFVTSSKGVKLTGSTSSDTLGVVTATEETMDTTDGELKTSLGRTGLRLGVGGTGLSSRFSSRRHG